MTQQVFVQCTVWKVKYTFQRSMVSLPSTTTSSTAVMNFVCSFLCFSEEVLSYALAIQLVLVACRGHCAQLFLSGIYC